MRGHGSVRELPEAGAADHLCWVHDDDEAFSSAVRDFLAGGLARGERLLCVGEGAVSALHGAEGALGDVDGLLADGVLETMTVAEAYAATGALSADSQRAFYGAATRRARADGYRGLRVVAEVTELAADPGNLAELVRWEHAADEFIASGSGMSAMCAYRSDLPASTLGDALAAHPTGHGPDHLSPWRLFFDERGLALAGSVDTFTAGRLATLLAGTPTGGHAVLDLSGLDFVDVAGCRTLAGWATALQERGVPLEIHGASALMRRVWRLLGLDEVVPVTFTGARG
jgi:anti-anti-sigma factor